ncbi:hypothetical protein PQR67_18170 [Paraburkholderia fungorum]|uniref:hypothetical protein n=1 Tax=Paraburkholderia fungorum TaxID=134537 RepID=UPI0038BB7BA4
MSAEYSVELSARETELRVWMSEWYDHAFLIGFIRPPYILDDVTALRLEGYFSVGLTPAEGVSAMFGRVH